MSTIGQHARDDLDALRAFDATDWLRAAVDTVLTPGLVARSMVHACVYAIMYGETGATTTYSVADAPIRADWWRPREQLLASLVSVWVLGWAATPYASLPSDPLLAGVVIMQSLPLALDPALTLWEVSG